jgi:transposase-like protein
VGHDGERSIDLAHTRILRFLYRSVDKRAQTVDFYLSRKRDVNAAKIFLRKAIKHRRVPTRLTLDAYAASHRAVVDLKQSRELPQRVKVRSTSITSWSRTTEG